MRRIRYYLDLLRDLVTVDDLIFGGAMTIVAFSLGYLYWHVVFKFG